ncbi:phytanoyl-CoA dioxygenase family protein [Azospirillum sp. sgz302134]
MKTPFNNKARWIDDVIWHQIPKLEIEPRRKRAASLVAPFRPRTPYFRPSKRALELKDQLETRGYTDAFRLMTDEQVAEMRRYFESQPCFDGGHRQHGSFTIDKVPAPEIQMARYVEEQFLAAPHLLDTINHPLVLEVAEAFHGCKPTIDGMSVWWSLARPNPRISTQNYHRDYNQVRHFKMFLYLTDTDIGGGPHIYVPGSQHGKDLVERRNYTDEEVEATYGKDAPIALTGRAGDCFLADNVGMHKALQPTQTDRLIVVTEYTLLRNRFGPLEPVLPNPGGRYDPYVNRVYLKS